MLRSQGPGFILIPKSQCSETKIRNKKASSFRATPDPVRGSATRNPAVGGVCQNGSAKNRRILCGSQSMRPGNLPVTNPTWPPERGNSNITELETSSLVGNTSGGRNGSFCAFRTRLGTEILLSQGLLLHRVQ